MDNLAHVIIPPEMTGVVLAIVERRVLVMDEGIASYLYGIAQERKVDIYVAIYGKGSGVNSCQSHFAYHIIVQGLALVFAQLSTHAQCMFVVFGESALGVWQFIVAEVVAGKCLQACLSPFAESFERSQCQGVLDAPVLGLVVDGITCKSAGIIILLEIVILWSLVCLVDAFVVIKLHRMYKACYRYVL